MFLFGKPDCRYDLLGFYTGIVGDYGMAGSWDGLPCYRAALQGLSGQTKQTFSVHLQRFI